MDFGCVALSVTISDRESHDTHGIYGGNIAAELCYLGHQQSDRKSSSGLHKVVRSILKMLPF
jgi:hypothetical protein